MADHSFGAPDESHTCKSEASKALMFCFDNAWPTRHVFVFLNAITEIFRNDC